MYEGPSIEHVDTSSITPEQLVEVYNLEVGKTKEAYLTILGLLSATIIHEIGSTQVCCTSYTTLLKEIDSVKKARRWLHSARDILKRGGIESRTITGGTHEEISSLAQYVELQYKIPGNMIYDIFNKLFGKQIVFYNAVGGIDNGLAYLHLSEEECSFLDTIWHGEWRDILPIIQLVFVPNNTRYLKRAFNWRQTVTLIQHLFTRSEPDLITEYLFNNIPSTEIIKIRYKMNSSAKNALGLLGNILNKDAWDRTNSAWENLKNKVLPYQES